MSRGTKLTPLRLSDDILDKIDAAIASSNRKRVDEPYNRTSWIKHAIEEKLAKLLRGRSRIAARKAESVSGAEPSPEPPPDSLPGEQLAQADDVQAEQLGDVQAREGSDGVRSLK